MPDRAALTRNAYSGAVLSLKKPSIHGRCSPILQGSAICNKSRLTRTGVQLRLVSKCEEHGHGCRGETRP